MNPVDPDPEPVPEVNPVEPEPEENPVLPPKSPNPEAKDPNVEFVLDEII